MEETAGKKRPGGTQVAGLVLVGSRLSLSPVSSRGALLVSAASEEASLRQSRGGNAVPLASTDRSMRLAVSIGDVRLRDLQGCIEHRDVLSASINPEREVCGGDVGIPG